MILGGAQGVLLLSLVGRMYSLQILQKDHYQTLSDKNRIHSFLVIPDRGLILDHKGAIIADNHNTYYGQFERDLVKDIPDLIQRLTDILKLTDDEIHFIKRQMRSKSRVEPIIIRDNICWDDVAKLEINMFNLPGVAIEKIRSRYYPYAEELSHVIGFVGATNEKEKASSQEPLMSAPGFRLGKTGLEKTFEDKLRGKAGMKQVEVNAVRKVVRTLTTISSTPGEKLDLNIDINLQRRVYEIMRPIESGACIVMDIDTGAIKAFVSFPGFNANAFVNQISRKDWRELSQSVYRPLINKAISGLYAPGSTFKMITGLAALEAGVVNPKDTYHCPGHFDYHGIRFHCWNWKQGGHGSVHMTHAISKSCDVYFYNLALQLKADQIADMAKRLGLGNVTGIEIPGEKRGLVPTPAWKLEARKQKWTSGETINISIGQGYLMTTPLQLGKMISILGNGGKVIKPHLIKQDQIEECEQLPFDPKHLDIIKQGLFDGVNEPWGTGFKGKLKFKDWHMCGKTGSTQVARITAQQRAEGTHNDRPWHLKEHALFTGYAPFDKPKYSIVVLVEHGGGGGKIAAPIAKEVMEAVKEFLE